MSRIFIALTPQKEFNQRIVELKCEQGKFTYKETEVNWSRDDQHHITVNFIGQMEPEQKQEMFEGLTDYSYPNKSLPLELSHLSYFPNENGQVLVANVTPSSQLQKLYEKVEEIVAKIGFGMTIRSFRPHITLARFKDKSKPFSQILEIEEPIKASVNSLDVYESEFESGKTKHSLIQTYVFE
mgnify:FL=1|tara:strand:- start:8 stop:556 length:549 start_codon:yes stop_codon:yes gene_type:complete